MGGCTLALVVRWESGVERSRVEVVDVKLGRVGMRREVEVGWLVVFYYE